MDVQATFLATLVDEWVRCGVTDAVVCPGNRSTLLAALLAQDDRVRVHVMVDERSASYFALGLGLATGRPTVFWCTSGTATAELHPAVIEAHQAHVPLLICTADRPPELQHARDWQSIDQSRLYEGMTRWRFDPGVATEAMSGSWRSIAARSVYETMHHPIGPGPVHLNLPIREPWALDVGPVSAGRSDGAAWHTSHIAPMAPSEEVVRTLAGYAGRPGVILVGRTDADPAAVHACATALGWPVLAEARSGCRTTDPTTIAAADELLRSTAFREAHTPEVVLRIGTPVLSKQVANWLQAAEAEEWLLDTTDTWVGPVPDASHIVRADATALCLAVTKACAPLNDDRWLLRWQGAEVRTQQALDLVLAGQALSEPGIARELVAAMPDGSNLFAATSMPVRDVESYAKPREGLAVYANRGASGMDGIVSTAAGVAKATGKPTALLVGDLTFLYDLNALWALQGVDGDVDLTVVVIDNNGGGIFSNLPQVSSISTEVFERVVATPTQVDIPSAVRGLGVSCNEVATTEAVVSAAIDALNQGGLRVVHTRTDRDASAALHHAIHALASDQLG